MTLRLALGVLVLALALPGCVRGEDADRESARKGGSITVALEREPASLDPAVASDPVGLQALWLVHTSPLTYARAEGRAGTQLVPGLAARPPEVSFDSRTFTFAFRGGLRYSDGRPLRAGDFERAVKRALRLHPDGLELFGNIEGARAYARQLLSGGDLVGVSADERTREVRVVLSEPDPAFAFALASPPAAPVPAGTEARDLSESPPPGIGPYRLAGAREGTAFVLTRRARFRLPGVPAGNVDEIAGVVQDPGGATRAVIDGFTDVFQGRPPRDVLPGVRSEFKDRYAEHATLAVEQFVMDPAKPPFDDEDLRRAVAFALDEAALARLRDNFLDPACNVLPPAVAGYEALDPCPFGEREDNSDLVRARTLVEDASAPSPPVLVMAGGDGGAAPAQAYLVATLRKIGLRARPALTSREREAAQVSVERRLPLSPHPARFLETVTDPVLATRISLLELEGDPADHAADWADLDAEAVQGATIAPYGIETTGVLLSERMDPQNCARFHPVFGLDWSSLCVR